MEIPIDMITGIAATVISIVGAAIAFFLRSVRDEFRILSAKIDAFSENLSKLDLVVSKVLLVQSICPHCPHPEAELETGLDLVKLKGSKKEEQ